MDGSILKVAAEAVARGCDLVAVLVVAVGAVEALARLVWRWRDYGNLAFKKEVWLRFASTIVLGLEFALGADIAASAIAPTWREIGQLAAIATIRTVLNLFLERDLEAARKLGTEA